MDTQMIYWLASTVAQSVVALLAFGAFVAISRRDALWDSVKGTLDELAKQCRYMDAVRRSDDAGNSETVYVILSGQSKEQISKRAEEGHAKYLRARDPDDRLDAAANEAELWLSVEWPDDLGKVAQKGRETIRDLGVPTISARNIRHKILRRLQWLTMSSVGAFLASLALISRAEEMQRVDWLNVGLIVCFEVVTGVVAASAALLTLACLGDRTKPSAE